VCVHDGREQIVRQRDGVVVAGQVQVECFHRQHLGLAAAGRPALHAKDRPERRLPDRPDRALTHGVERH